MAKLSELEKLSGLGFEETSTDDMAIPFLRILANTSPQTNKRDGAYVEGAEAGMVYNSVTHEVYDGVKGIEVIPCHYNTRYVEWTPRDQGGGYMGSYLPDDPVVKTTTQNERNEEVLPNGNLLNKTSQFFVLLVEGDQVSKALIPMTSTQLRKAKRWNSLLSQQTFKGSDGKPKRLPMMSTKFKLTTVEERNDKGSWFGWDIEKVGAVDELDKLTDNAMFQEGLTFQSAVLEGKAQIQHQALEQDASEPTAPQVEADDVEDETPF